MEEESGMYARRRRGEYEISLAEWSEPEIYMDEEKEEELEEIRTVTFVGREEALDLSVRIVWGDEVKKVSRVEEQMRTESGKSSPLDLRKDLESPR